MLFRLDASAVPGVAMPRKLNNELHPHTKLIGTVACSWTTATESASLPCATARQQLRKHRRTEGRMGRSLKSKDHALQKPRPRPACSVSTGPTLDAVLNLTRQFPRCRGLQDLGFTVSGIKSFRPSFCESFQTWGEGRGLMAWVARSWSAGFLCMTQTG